jgi:hypothetical protein
MGFATSRATPLVKHRRRSAGLDARTLVARFALLDRAQAGRSSFSARALSRRIRRWVSGEKCAISAT